MNNFLDRIKVDLEETSTFHPTITVSRKALEELVKEYERLLKEQQAMKIE